MSEDEFHLPHRRGRNRIPELLEFAQMLMEIEKEIGFKLSPRGWCYQLEGYGFIDKGQFNRVQRIINECREIGFLTLDFVAEEEARAFDCVNNPTQVSPSEFLAGGIRRLLSLEQWYEPDFWEDEEYYLQMLVEKIDLKTLFYDVCCEYHVPIATSKGWSSVSQRAEIISRFQIAEEKGLTPVLLYCGDLDPWGVEISNLLREHLQKLSRATRWNPQNLVIDRFGLNYEFIEEHGLTWIDNLTTSSGKQADRDNPIVRRYIDQYGIRKVEANAIVVIPDAARDLCISVIENYLGPGVLQRFEDKFMVIASEFVDLRQSIGLEEYAERAREILLLGGV